MHGESRNLTHGFGLRIVAASYGDGLIAAAPGACSILHSCIDPDLFRDNCIGLVQVYEEESTFLLLDVGSSMYIFMRGPAAEGIQT